MISYSITIYVKFALSNKVNEKHTWVTNINEDSGANIALLLM